MADRPPVKISDRLDSIVRGLPDDTERLRLLNSLQGRGGSAEIAEIARAVSLDAPGDAASVILSAAKDGLVQLSDDNRSVKITEIGRRLVYPRGGGGLSSAS